MIKDSVKSNLGEGTHIAHVITVAVTDSFNNFAGLPSEKAHEWDNPTKQVGIVFGSKEGTLVHRFSLNGWMKYDETSPEERDLIGETQKSEGRGYLVAVTDNGSFRMESEENKKKAERIFADFLRSLGLTNELNAAVTEEEELQLVVNFLKVCIDDRRNIQLVVKTKNGKEEYAYTKKVVEALVPAVEEKDEMGN